MKYLLLVSLILISSCSYLKKFKDQTFDDAVLDSTLLKNYASAMPFKERYKAPFISSYSFGDKTLTYVALSHPESLTGNENRTVKKAILDFLPNFILLEGSAFTIVSDPDDLEYARECERKHYQFCGEDAYAINMANDRGIAFSYGDPSAAALHSTLKKNGVTEDELIVFYTLKEIPLWKREGLKTHVDLNKAWKKKFLQSLIRASKKVRSKNVMSEAKFKKIFKLKTGKEFKIDEINREFTSPLVDMDPRWSNKMAIAIDNMQ